MDDMLRHAHQLLSVVVCAAALAAAPSAAQAAAEGECGSDDVVVVVEPATLDGDQLVRCATDLAGDATAYDALQAAGLDVEETQGSAPFVCRIDGRPDAAQETCGASLSGDGYWAFLTADEGGEWSYAQTGVRDHDVVPGEFLALRYQLLADGEDVTVETPSTQQTRAEAELVATPGEADDVATSTGNAVGWVEIIVFVLVLGVLVVGAVVLARRRRP